MEQTVVARLRLEVGQYMAGLAKAKAATSEFGREVAGVGSSSSKNVQAVGHASLLMAAGVGAAMGLAVKAAMDWETAWAGVTKTVSGSKAQMADLEQGLRGLATTLPTSHKEIAAVAEAAGQLGIQRDAIVGFTKTMVALGVSTNLSADEAATGIAKIANVMQTPQSEIDRFGATLVALGNVGASTESEILEMASRLAGAGKLVGASESDVLALANAMTSMGIEAQLGGGAFSRVMLKIFSATKDGGDKLKAFADVAGQTAGQFAASFKKSPIEAIDGLVHGLDRIDKGGGNVIATLRDLGFKGTQDLQVLLKLKGSGDLLAESLKLGSKAWQDNTALTKEAEKRYATTASQLQILKNQVVDVGIKFGGVMLPALKAVTGGVNIMVSGFGTIPSGARTAIVALGGVTTAGLGVIGMVGTFGPKVKVAVDALSGMGSLGKLVAGNLSTIGGATLIAGAALAVYTYEVGKAAQRQAEAKARTDKYTQAIKDQGAATGRVTDELALTAVVGGDVGTALRRSGQDLSVLTDALRTGGAPARKMRDDLADLEVTLRQGQGLPGMLHRALGGDSSMEKFVSQLQHGKLAGSELQQVLLNLAQSGDFTQGSMARLVARLREENAALSQGQLEAKNKAAADAALQASASGSASASAKVAKAFDAQSQSAAAATQAIKDMIDAEHAALDPLFGMLDAVKSNAEAQKALKDALAEGGHSTAEISDLQIAAAKSALDMDAAATQLAGSMATSGQYTALAKAQLQIWVDQSLISQATADAMGKKFEEAGAKADSVAGDRVISLHAETAQAVAAIDELDAKTRALLKLGSTPGGFFSQVGAPPASLAAPKAKAGGTNKTEGHAGGGWVGSAQKAAAGDTIPFHGSKGEFVLQASAVRRLGPSAVEHLNRTGELVGMQAGSRFGASLATSSSAAAAPTINMPPAKIEVRFDGGGDRYFKAWMRSWIRDEGGDVQRALGGGR